LLSGSLLNGENRLGECLVGAKRCTCEGGEGGETDRKMRESTSRGRPNERRVLGKEQAYERKGIDEGPFFQKETQLNPQIARKEKERRKKDEDEKDEEKGKDI
jgi:hypothetical protein